MLSRRTSLPACSRYKFSSRSARNRPKEYWPLPIGGVNPPLVERRPGSTADESGIDSGDGVGPLMTAPSEKKLHHGIAAGANCEAYRIAVQQVLEAEIAPRDRHLARVH